MIKAMLLALVLLLVGCATRPIPELSKTPDARQVYLLVRPTPDIANSSDWPAFRDEWRDQIAHSAELDGRHFTMLDGPLPFDAPAGTLVEVHISDYRTLLSMARVLFGLMTGNAFIHGAVGFYEYPGRRGIGTMGIDISSTAWGGVASAMTGRQVAHLTNNIFDHIQRREVALMATDKRDSAERPNNAVTRADEERFGRDEYTAERFARSIACQSMPDLTLVKRVPGIETYSAACTNGAALIIQCEFGNCRAMN